MSYKGREIRSVLNFLAIFKDRILIDFFFFDWTIHHQGYKNRLKKKRERDYKL